MIGQCLETAVAVGIAKNSGDCQPSPGQFSVHGVFHNLSVALAADKDGVPLWHVTDALFVAVGLSCGHETVGTHLQNVARYAVNTYGHQVETGRCRLVICHGIAIASQPDYPTVVARSYGLAEVALLVQHGLLPHGLLYRGRQQPCRYREKEQSSHVLCLFVSCKSTKNGR